MSFAAEMPVHEAQVDWELTLALDLAVRRACMNLTSSCTVAKAEVDKFHSYFFGIVS